MFTLAQINDIHDQLGKQGTLLQYLRALNDINVSKSDAFLMDGHTVYYSQGGQSITTQGTHEVYSISDEADLELLQTHLRQHEKGETSYTEMSRGLADAGVEKWTFKTIEPSVTYYDKTGNILLRELID